MVVQHNLTALGGLFLLLLSVQVATTSKQAAKGKTATSTASENTERPSGIHAYTGEIV